ncbi:hypothetical protein NDU88_005862 [Pleurodeles waltl]|uniref:Integrase catalytic domain-containing protein n=1 Tax=Pleurodeles waltl TaxID=8319 RepID=A0AAV7PPR4_PLEWA|nr:hypothetical protein NDU88_005862 [Pleurodeles waltl]
MAEVTTLATISVLREIFTEEGFPEVLITDNGTQLTSREMREYLESCGIRNVRTALYNPCANGTVERANRVIKGGLQLAAINNLDVGHVISELVWAYRTTEHVSTGKIPFEVMRGRKPVSRIKPSWMQEFILRCQCHHGKFVDKFDCKDNSERDDARIKPGDWVKVKSGRVRGGLSKLLGPFRVLEVHKWHVVLSNGQRWNKRRVAKFASDWDDGGNGESCTGYMLMGDGEVGEAQVEKQVLDAGSGDGVSVPDGGATNEHTRNAHARRVSTRPVSLRSTRSTRSRRPPVFLNDFVP